MHPAGGMSGIAEKIDTEAGSATPSCTYVQTASSAPGLQAWPESGPPVAGRLDVTPVISVALADHMLRPDAFAACSWTSTAAAEGRSDSS